MGWSVARPGAAPVTTLVGIKMRVGGFITTRVVPVSIVLLAAALSNAGAAEDPRRFVAPDEAGRLVYEQDDRGNRIPDFSHCGYMGGGVAIPDVPVRVVVAPGDGDAGPRIQAAIDHVAALPADGRGIRARCCCWPGATRSPAASGSRRAASSSAARATAREGRCSSPRGPTAAP